jgi:hypothetical protein
MKVRLGFVGPVWAPQRGGHPVGVLQQPVNGSMVTSPEVTDLIRRHVV